MPISNTVKNFRADSYYHVYNRGALQKKIFQDHEDYDYFTKLFSRYLSKKPVINTLGYQYPCYSDKLSLLSYCLMPNHFHLLLYQENADTLSGFIRSICTAYSMYFNRKYQRKGHVFESVYKASLISNDSYLLHISRYIHMNPKNYLEWKYSSLEQYLGTTAPEWLNTNMVANLLAKYDYKLFLRDYEERKSDLDDLKKLILVNKT